MNEYEFVVQGDQKIHCAGCEQRVSNALKRVPGVREVRADHRTQEVRVTTDEQLSRDDLSERLGRIGYVVRPKGA